MSQQVAEPEDGMNERKGWWKRIALIFAGVLASVWGISAAQEKTQEKAPASKTEPAGETHTLPSGLRYQDLKVGDGAEAARGKRVVVHYTGWLTNRKKFDSSLDRKKPFEFRLGAGEVIKGWDEGVAGMKVGGKRMLTIPPRLGYGAAGAGEGVIPPNATLLFEIELLEVK